MRKVEEMNEQGVHQAPIIVTLREMAELPVSPLLYGHFIELGYGIQTEPMAQGGEATAARSDLSLPRPVSLRKWPDAVGGAALSPRALGSAHRGLTLQEVGAEFTERECLLATDAFDSRATFGLFIPRRACSARRFLAHAHEGGARLAPGGRRGGQEGGVQRYPLAGRLLRVVLRLEIR